MLRKNEGSILVFSMLVFLFANICVISSANLINSNTRYSKYNYKDMYIREVCLSNIEFVRSKALEEVEKVIESSSNYDEFEKYFTENNSKNFIEKVKNISTASYQNSQVGINFVGNNESKYYYMISSKFDDGKFDKELSVYMEVKNPFEKDIGDLEEVDKNKLSKPKALVKVFSYKEG